MGRKSFIPRSVPELLAWFFNFAIKLSKYKEKYQISDDEIARLQTYYNVFNYWTEVITQVQEYSKSIVSYRNELLYGIDGNTRPLEIPTQPVFGPQPPNVDSNIVDFAVSLAKRIKSHHLFTETDGQDLGLFGATTTGNNAVPKPAFTTRLVNGGHPELVWKKGKQKGIQIFANYNDGNEWQSVGYDMTPNFTDMATLPKGNDSSIWRYRIIYVDNNLQPIGEYSDIVSVVVGGGI